MLKIKIIIKKISKIEIPINIFIREKKALCTSRYKIVQIKNVKSYMILRFY